MSAVEGGAKWRSGESVIAAIVGNQMWHEV